jgi:PAS domain S-box-containing protein
MRVLYVDEDASSRADLAMRLQPWVGGLDLAGNRKAGLANYSRGRQDIVVTDLRMPDLGGLAFSAEIRKLTPQQPILMLSAHHDTEYLYRSMAMGISHYLTKPVNTEELLEQLGGMARGILTRRERQRQRRLLEQYRLLLESSALVATLDPDGRITYANDRLGQLTGHDREALIGMSMQRLHHAEESPHRMEAVWQSVLAGEKWTGIVKHQTRDGRLLVLESTLLPILDDAGRVESVLCMKIDITDLHTRNAALLHALDHSQRSLREQRRHLAAYKRALDTGTCTCIVDPRGRVIDANRQFADKLGHAEGRLRELNLIDFAPQCDLGAVLETGHGEPAPWSQVLAMRHRHGAQLWFSVVFVPVRDEAGQIDSLILVCQDITESLELTRELMDTQRDLLVLVSQVVENRSLETGGHVKRVGEIARLLANRYGLDTERSEMIRIAAPLHDVGKVGIPDAILHKPAQLDAAEYEIMKAHASMGYQILSHIDRPLVRMAALIAHEHHERFDGLGYPRGLQGGAISIEGRIVALADVLDALAHSRSYKSAWDDDAIRAYLLEQRGRKFDPLLVDLALASWDDLVAIRERYRDD